MGEKKIKAKQTFDIQLEGRQRHALYQAFEVSNNIKEREDRKRFSRAYEALSLEDFEDLFPERDNLGTVTYQASQDFDKKLNSMKNCSVLTYENVESVLAVIDAGFKSGSFNGRGIRTLGPVEDLLEACKRGENLVPEEIGNVGNGESEITSETSA